MSPSECLMLKGAGLRPRFEVMGGKRLQESRSDYLWGREPQSV